MNPKHPRSRPFFTVRGFVVIVLAILLAAAGGYLFANYTGFIP